METLPLKLPKGSVRALLTLTVVGLSGYLLYMGKPAPPALIWVVFVVLGYYFGGRSSANAVRQELGSYTAPQGVEERKVRHPLFLPKGTVRFLLFAAIVGLSVWLYREGRLFQDANLPLVALVIAFVVGQVVATGLRFFGKNGPGTAIINHLKAVAALGSAAALTALVVLKGIGDAGSTMHTAQLVLSSVIVFYFASR